MKKVAILLSLLIIFACEDDKDATPSVDIDETPPKLSIISPISDFTYSDTVNIIAETSDESGILKVNFYIDDDSVHSDSLIPYNYLWNTRNYLNGSHEIKVVSYDTELNFLQDSILINIQNTIRYKKYYAYNNPRMIIEDKYSNYYLLGSNFTNSNYHGVLIKIDSLGSVIWNQIYGEAFSNDNTRFESFKYIENEGFIIIGAKQVNDNYDLLLIKTDLNGKIIWEKTIGGNLEDWGNSLVIHNDGFFILGRKTKDNVSYNWDSDIWLVKIDMDGDIVWEKTYESGLDLTEWATSLYLIDNGVLAIFGNNNSQTFMIKTDLEGNELSIREIDEINSISVEHTNSGNFIITGQGRQSQEQIPVIMVDKDGNEIWKKLIEGDTGYSIKQTNDNGFILSGTTVDGKFYTLLSKLNDEGDEIWSRVTDDIVNYYALQTMDGGYIVMFTYGVFKTDSDGFFE